MCFAAPVAQLAEHFTRNEGVVRSSRIRSLIIILYHNLAMNMSVSQIIKKDGKEKIYILFEDGICSAEGIYPDCRIIRNSNFTEKEVSMLSKYMEENSNQIKELAKTVSVWKAFSKN